MLEAVEYRKKSALVKQYASKESMFVPPFFFMCMRCFFFYNRWFDVLQKVSTQLKTSITSATKHRADKVLVSRYS